METRKPTENHLHDPVLGRLANYDQIFDRVATFPEKQAFVRMFRNKWKQEMGYTSVFERRQKYKQQKVVAATTDLVKRKEG